MSEVVRTFAFIDLAGFSALTETHGDRQAVDLLVRFQAIAAASLTPGGRVVKSIGDAVMLAFAQPAHAAETVAELLNRCRAEPDFPAIRVGVHHGPAIERDDDFFGTTVNIAARVAAHAAGDQLLVTIDVADAFRNGACEITSLGPTRLRNLADEIELFDVRLRDIDPAGVIDPVCRMRITPARAGAQLRIGNTTWWFCSTKCAAQFTAQAGSSASSDTKPRPIPPVNQALLIRARDLGAREEGLVAVTTSRADGSLQASVVNAGVLDHPVTGEPVVGFVARGGTAKLTNLRARPRATVLFRSGWEWVAVEGDADLVGPDDLLVGLECDDTPRLLRAVYAGAAGGTHDNWANLDDVMASERHTAVLIRPNRIYTNPGA